MRYSAALPCPILCLPVTLDSELVQLSRPSIISAALDILDRYGLADMTMRRVATSLSVAPGALYWHVANKQALIHAIAEEIVRPLVPGDGDNTSDFSSPEDFAAALHRTLLAHRDGAEVVSAALAQPGSTLLTALLADLRALLTSTSTSPHASGEREADVAAETVVHFILGATMLEQSRTQFAAATARGDSDAAPADVAPGSRSIITEGVAMILRGFNSPE